ncbi:hypothetical protein C8J57DRAFT_1320692 [Mycena rebaudengoi]|nr:hypothetical protein C8J57DRAFT_1320692 [Mycena rebaudengoi]
MVLFIVAAAALRLVALFANASPYSAGTLAVQRRADNIEDPTFPDSPESCGVCEEKYDSIKLCISVAPIMKDFTSVITNPGSFINVITCACSEPFKTTFPNCVTCFKATNQTEVLNMPDPDSVIAGINKVCALKDSFGLGDSSPATSSDTTSSTTSPPPATTSSGSARTTKLPLSPLSSFLLGGIFIGIL